MNKPWFKSKTMWVNLVALIASVTGAFGLDLGLGPEEQASIVGGIMAVVNVVLRVSTKGPVTLRSPALVGLCAVALAVLAACATPAAQTPEQKAFAMQSDYNALLEAAVAYESLPRCPEVEITPCSEPDVVADIRDAETLAYSALRGVKDALRADRAADEVQAALHALQTALVDLQFIISRRAVQ